MNKNQNIMEEVEKQVSKGSRGGYRPGAGRKATSPIRLFLRIPADVDEWLRTKGNKSKYIVDLIRKDMKPNEN